MFTDEVFILVIGADNSMMETFVFLDHIEKVGGHPGTVFSLCLFLIGSADTTMSRASQNFVGHSCHTLSSPEDDK